MASDWIPLLMHLQERGVDPGLKTDGTVREPAMPTACSSHTKERPSKHSARAAAQLQAPTSIISITNQMAISICTVTPAPRSGTMAVLAATAIHPATLHGLALVGDQQCWSTRSLVLSLRPKGPPACHRTARCSKKQATRNEGCSPTSDPAGPSIETARSRQAAPTPSQRLPDSTVIAAGPAATSAVIRKARPPPTAPAAVLREGNSSSKGRLPAATAAAAATASPTRTALTSGARTSTNRCMGGVTAHVAQARDQPPGVCSPSTGSSLKC